MKTHSTHRPSVKNDFTFEAATLRNGLLITCAYQCIQVIRDIITDAPPINIIINSLLLFVLTYIWLVCRKQTNTFAAAAVTHLAILPVFFFFWVNYNGKDGSVPYFIFLYFTFIIFTLHGSLRFLVLSLYGLMLTYLLAFEQLFNVYTYDVRQPEELLALSMDCFLSSVLLSIFFVRVKKRFENYRTQVKEKNALLQQVQHTIDNQNIVLHQQKEELETLNKNLSQLVLHRTQQVDEKNRRLAEYAFINAHVLRGPLSRVLGLLNLMSLEQSAYNQQHVKEMQKTAQEMDILIRKINEVLH
jgi:signal transduction histidine kinase